MNKSERKQIVLEAAASLVIDPINFDLLAGLTFDKLSAATGIDNSQISRDFSSNISTGKEGLLDELIDYALHPTNGAGAHAMDVFFANLEAVASSPDLTLEQRVEAWVDGLVTIASAKNQFHREMLLWGLSKEDSRLNIAFEKMFKNWIGRARIIIDDWYDEQVRVNGAKPQPGYSVRDFVVTASGLTLGLGILSNTSETLVPAGLYKRTILALAQSWLDEAKENGL